MYYVDLMLGAGERYEGSERLDTEWIKSGAASLEARIASSTDPNLHYTLRNLINSPSAVVEEFVLDE